MRLKVYWIAALLAVPCVFAEPPPAAPAAPAAQTAPAAPAAPKSTVPAISQADLLTGLASRQLLLLDVRTATEFAAGHIAGAINIPHDDLPNRMSELPQNKDAELVVYCRSGRRSAQALDWLQTQGFTRLRHLEGDFLGWQAANQPVSPAPPQL